MLLVFERKDGTATAVPVNGMSEIRVQTWTPAVFGDGGVGPRLVEDQTVALNDVVAIRLADTADGADVQVSVQMPEPISDEEAARLDAQFVTAPAIVADKPWDEAA